MNWILRYIWNFNLYLGVKYYHSSNIKIIFQVVKRKTGTLLLNLFQRAPSERKRAYFRNQVQVDAKTVHVFVYKIEYMYT